MNYGRWHGDNCKIVKDRKPRQKISCLGCSKLFSYNTLKNN